MKLENRPTHLRISAKRLARGEPGAPPGGTTRTSLCRNPEGRKKSGQRYSPSREAATQESSARQCRVAKQEQSRVPEGRHSSGNSLEDAYPSAT